MESLPSSFYGSDGLAKSPEGVIAPNRKKRFYKSGNNSERGDKQIFSEESEKNEEDKDDEAKKDIDDKGEEVIDLASN